MNKLVPIGLGAVAVIAVLFLGSRFIGSPTASVGGPPSQPPASTASPVGGTVEYQSDGGPSSTVVDAVADGASVSGTAVSTSSNATHNVRLECAAWDGDFWAVGGTSEQTTVPGELAGDWSAVIVKDGSPQQIAIWLSDDKSEGSDCEGWLGSIDLSSIGLENFQPVESGELVRPPDPAP